MNHEPNSQSIVRLIVSELSKHGISAVIETEVIGDGRTKITQCDNRITLDFGEHDSLIRQSYVKHLKEFGNRISEVRYE